MLYFGYWCHSPIYASFQYFAMKGSFSFAVPKMQRKLKWWSCFLISSDAFTSLPRAKVGIQRSPWRKCFREKTSSQGSQCCPHTRSTWVSQCKSLNQAQPVLVSKNNISRSVPIQAQSKASAALHKDGPRGLFTPDIIIAKRKCYE